MSSSKPAGQRVGGHWSDGETTALVQTWGQLYLRHNRLSDADWRDVCVAVNAHRAATAGRRFDRSVVHCRWRLYSLKSKYKKELAKNGPSRWRHFAQLRAFLASPHDGPPPGFAAKMSAAAVGQEEMVEEEEVEEATGGASGSVPAKRRFSSLQNVLNRSGGPPHGLRATMPATSKKEKEEVGEEGPAHDAASTENLPGAVVRKLAEVYRRVETERLSFQKQKMAMTMERRAAKVEAENLGETDDH